MARPHKGPQQESGTSDLLGISNQCFLAMLGAGGIPAGHYQQIRIFLAANNVTVSNNKCGTVANCVMLTSDPSPSGQIAGGEFTIGSGETKDLNIDFNACASMVVQGNGKYRLKPVLHAGEVATQSTATSISGTIIDGSTQQAVVSGTTIVALEQKDPDGVDRVVMETVAASMRISTLLFNGTSGEKIGQGKLLNWYSFTFEFVLPSRKYQSRSLLFRSGIRRIGFMEHLVQFSSDSDCDLNAQKNRESPRKTETISGRARLKRGQYPRAHCGRPVWNLHRPR